MTIKRSELFIILNLILMTQAKQIPQKIKNHKLDPLSDNYIGPLVQTLLYYIEFLKFEPQFTTTLEPPLSINTEGNNIETSKATAKFSTASKITTTLKPSITTKRSTIYPWWTSKLTTKKNTWWPTTQSTSKKTTNNNLISPIGSTTNKPTVSTWWSSTTRHHAPGYFAPPPQQYLPPKNKIVMIKNDDYKLLPPNMDDNFDTFDWLLRMSNSNNDNNLQLLDPLPNALIRDIVLEDNLPSSISDFRNVDEFSKLFDDSYRLKEGTRKFVPSPKPYVEFILLSDHLKKEAKIQGLNKYFGYSKKLLNELSETSTRSAERQLHTIMTQAIKRGDIQKPNLTNRIKSIIKDIVSEPFTSPILTQLSNINDPKPGRAFRKILPIVQTTPPIVAPQIYINVKWILMTPVVVRCSDVTATNDERISSNREN